MAAATRGQRAHFAVVALLAAAVAAAAAVRIASAAPPLIRTGSSIDEEWTPLSNMTDEWNSFDDTKWRKVDLSWYGRAPGVFKADNVDAAGGRLSLVSRRDPSYEYPPNPKNMEPEPRAYDNYTTAFVESLSLARYGYFETRALVGYTVISSAFWASWQTDTDWTEIDVFEIGGGAPGDFPYQLNMNTHVFRLNGSDDIDEEFVSTPQTYTSTERLAERYHVYALEWNETLIVWFFDGRIVHSRDNLNHHQALAFKFDSETMPDWFGLPQPSFQNTTYYVDYIRAYQRRPTDRAATRARGASPLVLPATGAAIVSPYALQRAPTPNSREVLGLGPTVPRGGWGSLLAARGKAAKKLLAYLGPVVV